MNGVILSSELCGLLERREGGGRLKIPWRRPFAHFAPRTVQRGCLNLRDRRGDDEGSGSCSCSGHGPTGSQPRLGVRVHASIKSGLKLSRNALSNSVSLMGSATALSAQRAWFLATIRACAIAFSGYISWVHWEQLAEHWSQRDLFHTYFTERKGDEPIAAYMMNWKGETFYGKNLAHQMQDPTSCLEFLHGSPRWAAAATGW